MNRTAFITGATSGIGKATAYELSKHNFNLILCGRREDKLKLIKADLENRCEIHLLSFDVRNKTEVFDAVNSLPDHFKSIDLLLNNAGNAHGKEPMQDGRIDDWDAMIDINIKGLLYITKAVFPLLKDSKHGHIINIGSTAGKEVYPGGNVYCASKHAVNALNEAMRIDFNSLGIKVTAIHPGMVETEFSEVRFKGDKEKAKKVYEGFTPLYAQDIAEIIAFTVTRPAHVCIADLVVTCTAQATSTIVNK